MSFLGNLCHSREFMSLLVVSRFTSKHVVFTQIRVSVMRKPYVYKKIEINSYLKHYIILEYNFIVQKTNTQI